MQTNWLSSFPTDSSPVIVSGVTHRANPPVQNFATHEQTTADYDSLLSSVDHPATNGMNPGKNHTNRRLAIEANLKSKFNKSFPQFS